jgi:hypothetical protein
VTKGGHFLATTIFEKMGLLIVVDQRSLYRNIKKD